ncbi:signal peptide peptidase SppA [Candidatus Woesearchaeota archaeon]|nr:hypothetical protein [uncultured archaeon]MBS3124449.1 signal peptide peptidase SppA [Candidatus Woesearchaeota archaeon]
MKKKVEGQQGCSRTKTIILTTIITLLMIFVIFPLILLIFGEEKIGNVALIPITGVITTDGSSYLGSGTTSSADIVSYLEEANNQDNIKAIVLEINSPGGTPVATEEITGAINRIDKPVIALIREMGASSAYWIASSTDHIVASRMSITGSIGVISSYLEFSGLMEKYGIGYERLVAGDSKDVGTPFRKLTTKETEKIQERLDRLHNIFINEVAENRQLSIDKVKKLADGDVLLGEEALEAGLVDQLGDKVVLESYLKSEYDIEDITYSTYQKETSFFELISGMTSQWSFKMGEGIGAIFLEKSKEPFLI